MLYTRRLRRRRDIREQREGRSADTRAGSADTVCQVIRQFFDNCSQFPPGVARMIGAVVVAVAVVFIRSGSLGKCVATCVIIVRPRASRSQTPINLVRLIRLATSYGTRRDRSYCYCRRGKAVCLARNNNVSRRPNIIHRHTAPYSCAAYYYNVRIIIVCTIYYNTSIAQ